MFFCIEDFEIEKYEENLDYVVGREYEKKVLFSGMIAEEFDNLLYVPNNSNYLLTGPAGYGKSYLAKCYAQTLKEAGYKVYQIDCWDIMDDQEDCYEEWKVLFDEVLKRTNPYDDYNEKICLYFNHMDAINQNRKCILLMENFLNQLKKEDCRCIVLTTTTEVSDIPSNVVSKFFVLRLGLPNEEERQEYFRGCIHCHIENPMDEKEEKEFYPIEFSDSIEDDYYDKRSIISLYCAERTEGLSFGQLEKVVDLLIRALKVKLMFITDGDANAVWSYVNHGRKNYTIENETFDKIISSIKNENEKSIEIVSEENANRHGKKVSYEKEFEQVKENLEVKQVYHALTQLLRKQEELEKKLEQQNTRKFWKKRNVFTKKK